MLSNARKSRETQAQHWKKTNIHSKYPEHFQRWKEGGYIFLKHQIVSSLLKQIEMHEKWCPPCQFLSTLDTRLTLIHIIAVKVIYAAQYVVMRGRFCWRNNKYRFGKEFKEDKDWEGLCL